MRLGTFRGGVHPPDKKELAKDKPIQRLPLPDTVYVYMVNHAGAPAKVVVQKDQEVKTGQVIGEPSGFISAYVHSPVTGKVIDIKKMYHPIIGKPVDTVVIQRTSDDEWELLEGHGDYERMDKEQILDLIKRAGIVGLGGAMFPTHVKLNPPPDKKVDTLIINGAECEPYLTIDYRTMLERTDEIATGIKIIRKVLGVEKVYVGIEDNKPEAIKRMREVLSRDGVEVVPLRTKYPQGSEKHLIYAITGRKVPRGGLPMDVGVVVQNVGTVVAIKEAVVDGKPLVERGLTVTGEAVQNPGNFIVRIGTPAKFVLDHTGLKESVERVLFGGPMMGIALRDINIPVMKGTSGITALPPQITRSAEEKPCIRCSRCVMVCPMNLEPYLLVKLVQKKRYDDAVSIGLMDCIECGSCAYVCPSKIDHVRHIKLGKTVYKALRGAKR